MSEGILILANLLIILVEFATFIIFLSAFFNIKRTMRQGFLICVIGFLMNCLVISTLANFAVLKTLLCVLILVAISKTICQIQYGYCILIAVLYLSMAYLTDLGMIYLVSEWARTDLTRLITQPMDYYLLVFLSKIVLVLIVVVVRTWGKQHFHHRPATVQNYLLMIALPFASLVCGLLLFNTYFQFPAASGQLLLCTVILLIFDFAAIFLLDRFEYQQQELLKSRILQQELESAKNSVATLMSSYSSERKLTHDIQNHITVIRGMLSRDASSTEILSYLNGVDGRIQVNRLSITTHRMVADIILNQKYQVACGQETAFRVQMDDLSKFPLPDDELVVVLSNLIDNALEACRKIDQVAKRYVLVKSRIFHNEAIFYISNPTAQPVKIRNNHIVTTKKNGLRHGYGLQNVLSISAAHEGDCALHYKNGVFSCVLRFDIET